MESPPSPPASPPASPPVSTLASTLASTPATLASAPVSPPESPPASPPASPSDSDLSRALSLHQILRLHPRERLSVHPAKWTSRHLELLNCSFELPSPAVFKRARLYPPCDERKAAGRAYRFATTFGLGGRRNRIEEFLEDEHGPLVSFPDGFSFRYRQRSVGRLPCVGFSLRPQSRDTYALPIAAWTEFRLIDGRRGRGVRNADRRYNPPVRQLELLQWQAITPKEPLHDPCILALLVAVAQGQRSAYTLNEGQTNRPIYRAHVIWTDARDEERVHLFTADIPSVLLDMFDCPSFVPPAAVSISIRYRTVPFKPYKKLYSRLLSVILPDSYTGTRKEPKPSVDGNEGPQTMAPEQPQESVGEATGKGQSMVLTQQPQGEG